MTYKNRSLSHTGLWRRATNPNISIVKRLASKLLAEVEGMNDRTFFAENFSLDTEVEKFEADMIRHALAITGGHQLRAAHILGIKPTTLNNKIKRFGIYITKAA